MYLRFVVGRLAPRSRLPMGIFVAAGGLLDRAGLDPAWHDEIEEQLHWFNVELPVPRHEWFRGGKAVCWFKEDAREMIQRLWPLAAALREHDVPVRVVRAWRVGRIRYQDRWQVVAVPRRR